MHAAQRRDAADVARPRRRPPTAIAALAAVLALLLIGASAAHADVLRRTSGADITINDAGGGPSGATPFPAMVSISNVPADRKVVGVRVKLDDVTHDYASDLDVALVGPGGQKVMLMSDVGGKTKLNAADLTFDDEAGAGVDLNTIASGAYRPTDDDQGAQDTMPAGAPPGDYAARLDTFEGTSPNGEWSLYVVDDASGMAGTIGGWQLTVETGPAPTNAQQVLINDEGSGVTGSAPYPVPIQVSGVRGRVAEASVVLHGLRHGDPDDIDIMLEGPEGKRTTLMSDAGGGIDIAGRTVRFDDDATDALDDAGQITSGTTMPVNFEGADTFPAPAPAQPDPATDTGLAEFEGLDPNGTWKLWVVDDADGEAGKIDAGWTLQLELEPYFEFASVANPVKEDAGTRTITVKRPEGGGAATIDYSVNAEANPYDIAPTEGTLSFATGQKTKTFTATVLDDTADEVHEELGMSLHGPTGDGSTDQTGGGASPTFIIEDDDAADVHSDFNGDGRGDAATGTPGENVGAIVNAGAVSVIYGDGGGLTATGNQRFTQDSAGVPDTAEAEDRFGAAVASGDFNGDGFSDLAIGAPGEETGAASGSGAVTILYGSAGGLTTAGSELLHQDSAGVPNAGEAGDRFGEALAAGNFGRTAHGDLAVGQPGEDVGAGDGAGGVTTLYGDASGLSGTGAQFFSQDLAGFPDAAETGDALGSSLAAGDLGRGAERDLAIGAPGENDGAGVAHVLYGTPANGLALTGVQVWSQSSEDVIDGAAAGDGFGAAVAIGEGLSSTPGKLAIGAPAEDIGAAEDAGVVHVLGADEIGGVGSRDNQLWAQSSGTVVDSPEDGDEFGASLAWGDFGADVSGKLISASPQDLAIGVPGEDADAGGVAVLYSDEAPQGGGWLTDATDQLWQQDSSGVLGTSDPGDRFGAALAPNAEATNVDALAIGVPGDASGAGALALLQGSSAGYVSSGNDQRFSQGTGGILDAAEGGDGFGSALAK